MPASKSSDKSDAKGRKIIDVTEPGKSAPSPTAKPIIVSNRPILRRDPMVAAPGDVEEHSDITPVSRTARTIKIATLQPLTAVEKAGKSAPAAPARPVAPTIGDLTKKKAATAKAAELAKPANTLPKAEEEKVGKDLGVEAVSSVIKDPTAPTIPARSTTEDDITDVAAEPKPEAAQSEATGPSSVPKAPETETTAPLPVASEPEKDTATAATEPTEAAEEPENTAADTTASQPELELPAQVPQATTSVPDEPEDTADSDGQLAPNQIVDQAKRKEEDEKAAKAAEQEKIIAGKQYYLPIKSPESRRSLDRFVLLFALVLLLALVWLDIVLDAGIVRINGIQPLTHFFRQ